MGLVKKEYAGPVYSFFHVLNSTGVRANELLDVQKWSYDSDSSLFVLQTSKKGNKRYFNSKELHPIFIKGIQENINPFHLRTSETFRYIFKKIRPYPIFVSTSKELTLHVFRHKTIIKLNRGGLSNEQIARKMGLVALETVEWYLTAHISKKIV